MNKTKYRVYIYAWNTWVKIAQYRDVELAYDKLQRLMNKDHICKIVTDAGVIASANYNDKD
jgi:hypothetical protein|tara:strand:- start:771 stop:953 length:183 start_codon:yes stop_codon:yes gene_type:complete